MIFNTAASLRQGQVIHPLDWKGKPIMDVNGKTPQRYVVTSVKTWKTRPTEIRVRARRGLRDNIEITANHLYAWVTEAEYVTRFGNR